MTEDKTKICHELARVLRLTRAGWDVEDIRYHRSSQDEEEAVIIYLDGVAETVNVSLDSGVAMIRDILRALS